MDEQSTPQVEAQTESSEPKRSIGLGWFLWPPVALLLYLLSFAPALKLTEVGILPEPVFLIVYTPINVLCHYSAPAGRFFSWYLELWRTHAAK